MLRVFIVEDEAPARRHLQRLVRDCGAQVVGEAGSVAEAVALLPKTESDVALLDIELGDGTAFDLLEQTGGALECATIFCTAYSHYAVEAFSFEAIDYLLKPVELERLGKALARVKPKGFAKRLLVEHKKALRFVNVETIDWIEADRNYAVLHVGQEEFVLRSTLEGMERKLDPHCFARANRGAIVNVASIARLEKSASGEWEAVLPNNVRILCSKKYWPSALEKLL